MSIDVQRHLRAISRGDDDGLTESLAPVFRDFTAADPMPRPAIPAIPPHVYQFVNFTTTFANFRYYRLHSRP